MKRILIAAALSIFICQNASAELVISTAGVTTTVTFDSTLTGSNKGQFKGGGLQGSGGSGVPNGLLDSRSWLIAGMSDGDTTYGGTYTSGDYARGESSGGVTTGGLYAFDRGASNHILGIQPSGADFTPGSITLRLTNDTGEALSDFDIAYDIWNYNDQGRSNSLNFSYSIDNVNFTSVDGFDFATVEAADGSPTWQSTNRAGNFSQSVANGANLYLRWTGRDVGGSGSRDEYGIDDISITFNTTAVPEPTSFLLFGTVIAGFGFRRRRK